MYDKFKKILRIETTVNNLTFFKHYRTVEHRDRTSSKKFAAMKKNIYSLAPYKSYSWPAIEDIWNSSLPLTTIALDK